MPAACRRPVKAKPVNRLPWSVLNISGAPGRGLVESVCAEARVQRVRQPPGQDVPARPVHDRHQVKEAALHRDIGDVDAPDMVRPLDVQASQQIRVNPVLGVGRAGAWRPIDCLKPHRAHQPPGPASADPHALAAQVKCHPTGAVERVLSRSNLGVTKIFGPNNTLPKPLASISPERAHLPLGEPNGFPAGSKPTSIVGGDCAVQETPAP